jgi:hypothetical protein
MEEILEKIYQKVSNTNNILEKTNNNLNNMHHSLYK